MRDGDGGTTSAADPADVPDDGNDCTIEGCDGLNPTTDWETAGAPCNAGGVCNGAGVCGVCVPGAKKCDGKTPQLCNAAGQWDSGSPCANVCTAGECTGLCQPGSENCNGTTPQTCGSNGQWVDGSPCPYVCSGGNCTGVCVPGSNSCKDLRTKQRCDNSGSWTDNGTCSSTTPFCIEDGKCGCPGTAGPAMLGVPGGFCVDTTEVTRGQYKAWIDTNPSTAGQPSYCSWNTSFNPLAGLNWPPSPAQLDFPVVDVDWCDARAYCVAAGKRLCGAIGGGSAEYYGPNVLSVSQWFSVCTSGGQNDYTYGDTFQANACFDSAGTFGPVSSLSTCQSPVAAYQGIFDLSGNVAEWEDACHQYVGAGDSCLFRGGIEGACAANSSLDRADRDNPSWHGFRCCSDP